MFVIFFVNYFCLYKPMYSSLLLFFFFTHYCLPSERYVFYRKNVKNVFLLVLVRNVV